MSSTCSVCSRKSSRDLVNSALTRGLRPSEIVSAYPDIASRSAIYRHCRSHAPRTLLGVRWVSGDATSGDVLDDLDQMRRVMVVTFNEAVARGEEAAAQRAAREVNAASAQLLKLGMGEGEVAAEKRLQRLVFGVQRAGRTRPEWASELAQAFSLLGDEEFAKEADELYLKAAEQSELN